MSSARRITATELTAFIDGELELARQLEVEARLATDAALRAELEALRGLQGAVRERADYHAAPAALRARLQSPPEPPARPTPAPTPAIGWRRWFAWRPMLPAFAVAALAVWGMTLWLGQPGRNELLMQEVIASHVRSTVGQRLVDVASSDQHTVKPWLSARLDYSPPVADAPVPGAVFVGGRIDYLDGRPVAALVYRQRQHLIDAYIWPSPAHADSSPMQTLAQRGFNLVHWSRGAMSFWLVSDINRDELAGFARAIDKADAAR